MTSYRTQCLLKIRQIYRHFLHQNDSVDKWHSILTDPSSAVLLRQQDDKVNELQNKLQEFSISGRETFASAITYFTIKVGIVDNENEIFSIIRTVLEIFILYSISTSDFRWISDKRATHMARQAEVLSEYTYSPSQITCPPEASSTPDCLRLAALREKISRREHYRASIIKKIVKLADTMPLDLPFVTYDHENPSIGSMLSDSLRNLILPDVFGLPWHTALL